MFIKLSTWSDHKLCLIYASFEFLLFKNIFVQKSYSNMNIFLPNVFWPKILFDLFSKTFFTQIFFGQKRFLPKEYWETDKVVVINLTTRGALSTCLVHVGPKEKSQCPLALAPLIRNYLDFNSWLLVRQVSEFWCKLLIPVGKLFLDRFVKRGRAKIRYLWEVLHFS